MILLHSTYRLSPAQPADAAECLRLRGLTRENAFSPSELQALGITEASWRAGIASGELIGQIAWAGARMAGYCFADRSTGEIMVLALLPEDEGHGLGRLLLTQVVETLRQFGWRTLFLSCSSDPGVRSYGFYRHLGWRHEGATDDAGDHILVLTLAD